MAGTLGHLSRPGSPRVPVTQSPFCAEALTPLPEARFPGAPVLCGPVAAEAGGLGRWTLLSHHPDGPSNKRPGHFTA